MTKTTITVGNHVTHIEKPHQTGIVLKVYQPFGKVLANVQLDEPMTVGQMTYPVITILLDQLRLT